MAGADDACIAQNWVLPCLPGFELENWVMEDQASLSINQISDTESYENDNLVCPKANFSEPIHQVEEEGDDEWELSPDLLRLVEQEE